MFTPLPFANPRRRIPNIRAMVLHHAESFKKSFRKYSVNQEHIITFMQKLFECKHDELALLLKIFKELKEYRQKLESWRTSLTLLKNGKIRRLYTSLSIRNASLAL